MYRLLLVRLISTRVLYSTVTTDYIDEQTGQYIKYATRVLYSTVTTDSR